MSRKKSPPLTAAQRRLRLERQLSLVHWLSKEFGFKDNADMLSACRESEGQQGDVSRVCHTLQGRELQIPVDALVGYEYNIKKHLDRINRKRSEPIALKYFQQLAALGVERYLHLLSDSPNQLLARLNDFVYRENGNRSRVDMFDEYHADDLKKIAFWMATGSGKTLLLHLNYLQYLHYFPKEVDNILLVTPNENLSEQHREEFKLSGIAARRVEESADLLSSGNPVQIVEITKLVEKKRGRRGASIPLERFEGKNLLLVDEGHKGSGGEAWFKSREILGRDGFTFEYSATFGQALFAAGRGKQTAQDTLTKQYGKNILVDYSYKYFYDDGFGKDFNVSNLTGQVEGNRVDLLMTGNLLSFYQQMCCYEERRDELRPYHLEKPLLLLLGSTVTTTQSDVVELVGFLHRFLKNENGKTVADIKAILAGKSGFMDDRDNDLFREQFPYIKGRSAKTIYRDVLQRVFQIKNDGALYLRPIKRNTGEIGLKIGEENQYFAVIFVGNSKKLCELIAQKYPAVHVVEDAISDSLFGDVNSPLSPVNLLVGAKKFMEGWNSWRVAGMGLLNVGKSEGAEIIQLFGRGVRLRGRGMTLKRSVKLGGSHPQYLRLLETLNIFAVRADFIANFRLYLERENVDKHAIPLSIRIDEEFLGRKLSIPKIPDGFNGSVALVRDKKVSVTLDFSERTQSLSSDGSAVTTTEKSKATKRNLTPEQLSYIDWENLYIRLLEHKRLREWDNLLVCHDELRGILEEHVYINAPDKYLDPESCENFTDIRRIRDIAAAGLQKYADKLHHVRQMRWQTEHMSVEELDSKHGNFKHYTVLVPRDQKKVIEEIEQAARDTDWAHEQKVGDLSNVYFDRHLFQPLLSHKPKRDRDSEEQITVTPASLEDSEKKFVNCLIEYCRNNRKQLEKLEIFLLRNLPHSGIGFPSESGDNFYPDFILWVKRGREQRVVFVEPHGMLHEGALEDNSKIQLHKWLADISAKLQHRYPKHQVEFDSFLVSETHSKDVEDKWGENKTAMADRHVLFMDEDEDFVSTIIKWQPPQNKPRRKPR